MLSCTNIVLIFLLASKTNGAAINVDMMLNRWYAFHLDHMTVTGQNETLN